jgi:hypothetical protein
MARSIPKSNVLLLLTVGLLAWLIPGAGHVIVKEPYW